MMDGHTHFSTLGKILTVTTQVNLWAKCKKPKWSGMFFWGGGTNLSDAGLNLSGSWQQGHSATYNTPSRI